jgi:undecaprenyl-diphosphatase
MRQRFLDLDNRFSWLSQLTNHSGALRTLAAAFAHSGDSWLLLPLLGILWYFGTAYWKQRAVAMVVGVALTAAVVFVIKLSVRRSRPQGEWGKIYRNTDPHSFPSGHAARAMMLAVMALGLGPTWLGLALLLWAPLVGMARVALGVHYPSDVAAGMVVGTILGLIVVWVY